MPILVIVVLVGTAVGGIIAAAAFTRTSVEQDRCRAFPSLPHVLEAQKVKIL